jgi:hypothetical protein
MLKFCVRTGAVAEDGDCVFSQCVVKLSPFGCRLFYLFFFVLLRPQIET